MVATHNEITETNSASAFLGALLIAGVVSATMLNLFDLQVIHSDGIYVTYDIVTPMCPVKGPLNEVEGNTKVGLHKEACITTLPQAK